MCVAGKHIHIGERWWQTGHTRNSRAALGMPIGIGGPSVIPTRSSSLCNHRSMGVRHRSGCSTVGRELGCKRVKRQCSSCRIASACSLSRGNPLAPAFIHWYQDLFVGIRQRHIGRHFISSHAHQRCCVPASQNELRGPIHHLSNSQRRVKLQASFAFGTTVTLDAMLLQQLSHFAPASTAQRQNPRRATS